MDRFGLLGGGILPLAGLLAGASQGAAGAVVVVAKLHDHDIARLEHGEHPVPVALGDERAGARAADGAVDDVDLRPVEGLFERIAPAELAVAAVAPAGPHGGVADEEERGKRRVAGLGQVEPALEVGGVGTRSPGWAWSLSDHDVGGRGGPDRPARGGEAANERLIAKPFQAGDDELGVELRALVAGVGMIAGEEGLHGVFPHLLVAVGDQRRQVDERHPLRRCDLAGPLAIPSGAAFDASLLPDIADGQREQDGSRPLRLRVGDHLAEVPAEGVYDLMLLGEEVVDFLRLVAEPGERAARPALVVDRAAIVVTELDQDEIAGLHAFKQAVPEPLGDERPAAPPSAGEVDDLELRRVEERLEVLAPADGARGAVGRGGVAGDEQGGGAVAEAAGGALGSSSSRRR